jgi:hypothetical protein
VGDRISPAGIRRMATDHRSGAGHSLKIKNALRFTINHKTSKWRPSVFYDLRNDAAHRILKVQELFGKE